MINVTIKVNHPNVIRLLGACTDHAGPLYLIMEFAVYGSLRYTESHTHKYGTAQKGNQFVSVSMCIYSLSTTQCAHNILSRLGLM